MSTGGREKIKIEKPSDDEGFSFNVKVRKANHEVFQSRPQTLLGHVYRTKFLKLPPVTYRDLLQAPFVKPG